MTRWRVRQSIWYGAKLAALGIALSCAGVLCKGWAMWLLLLVGAAIVAVGIGYCVRAIKRFPVRLPQDIAQAVADRTMPRPQAGLWVLDGSSLAQCCAMAALATEARNALVAVRYLSDIADVVAGEMVREVLLDRRVLEFHLRHVEGAEAAFAALSAVTSKGLLSLSAEGETILSRLRECQRTLHEDLLIPMRQFLQTGSGSAEEHQEVQGIRELLAQCVGALEQVVSALRVIEGRLVELIDELSWEWAG